NPAEEWRSRLGSLRGTSRAMARPRQRIPLEDGLKLDLNSLLCQRSAWGEISWGLRYSGKVRAFGFFSLHLSGASRGSMRLHLSVLEQSIDLEAAPRHFGGSQWYFICPLTR